MKHEEVLALADAYLDRESDPLAEREIDAHLVGCAACRTAVAGARGFSALLRAEAEYFEAPPALVARLTAAGRPTPPMPRPVPRRMAAWRPLALAASLLLAVVLAGGVGYLSSLVAPQDRLVQQVVDGHVRSLQAEHLTDVASSDQHTVKPWFDGRLDSAPPVRDFTGDGFPLVGGRLDYLDGRPVAALVYRHRRHPINLFVGPAGASGAGLDFATTRQGYNVRHWVSGDMSFWLVSDLDMSELSAFEALVRRT
jgi:anti-sigma factor RsiW